MLDLFVNTMCAYDRMAYKMPTERATKSNYPQILNHTSAILDLFLYYLQLKRIIIALSIT